MSPRVIWRRAHPVRLPPKPTEHVHVHDELRAARLADLIRQKQDLEEDLACALARDLSAAEDAR